MSELTSIVEFHRYPQDLAISTFIPILQIALPHSNPLYNRLQAPHNLLSRHCLFAATFPPPLPRETLHSTPPEDWTILFADRSRHKESQIWCYNSLLNTPTPLTEDQQASLELHLQAAVQYLKNIQIPEAPGWPFLPMLKFACLHELCTNTLYKLYPGAIPYCTSWNYWILRMKQPDSDDVGKKKRELPEGYKLQRVPDDQLDIVISTSTIQRQPDTLKLQANVGIINEKGVLTAWGYIGIDGSIATLYVMPEERGKGLATLVARELLGMLERGAFEDLGIGGRSGWVHADVKVGNKGSEGVMRSLGGIIAWQSSYIWVDGDGV